MSLKDIFGLLMRKDCELATKEAVIMDDMNYLPLIFFQQTHHSTYRTELFGKRYEKFNIVATNNFLLTVLSSE